MKIKSQPWIEWRVQENLCLLLNNGSFLSEHLQKKFIFGVGLKLVCVLHILIMLILTWHNVLLKIISSVRIAYWGCVCGFFLIIGDPRPAIVIIVIVVYNNHNNSVIWGEQLISCRNLFLIHLKNFNKIVSNQ